MNGRLIFIFSLLLVEKINAKNIQHAYFNFKTPSGWMLRQSSHKSESQVWVFTNSRQQTVTLSFSKEPLSKSEDTSILETFTYLTKKFNWKIEKFLYQQPQRKNTLTTTSYQFTTETPGGFLSGYTQDSQEKNSERNALAFVEAVTEGQGNFSTRSLTPEDPFSKKYYLGVGRAANGDPTVMQNEVKFDVLHTHDIFTKKWGGFYTGKTFIGKNEATRNNVIKAWKQISDDMTFDDMYVQYTSSHGSEAGIHLQNDLISYDEIRDNALKMPAKEIIIFIMACHSGTLLNSFNKKENTWKNWQQRGKTLFVLASSAASTNSVGGPGTDPDESSKANGSAGSAFGHALWKALIGYADGSLDGVKDGFISLGEIEKFTIKKTKQVSAGQFQHTPVSVGSYTEALVMNEVPSKEVVAQLEKDSQSLSDEDLWKQIQEYDKYLMEHPQQ